MSIVLSVLYQDEHLIAINKPAGMLVHRSPIDRHETVFAVQLLRDQIHQRVHPLHRLDKPTSGVLLFALDPDTARAMGQQFAEHNTEKRYYAVVRGHVQSQGCINHALTDPTDKYDAGSSNRAEQKAITEYHRLAQTELPTAIDKYPSSRYSWLDLKPKTGRRHQIRKHLKHISHPIIGDVNYGKGSHNRYFRESLNIHGLLLHAHHLSFQHPLSNQSIHISAPLDQRMNAATALFPKLNIPLLANPASI